MAYSSNTDVVDGVWFADSCCSNHMSGSRALFRDIDETHKSDVQCGDDK